MKILPAALIREADAYTILHEPIAGIDLMERAAGACFTWIKAHLPGDRRFMIFCGAGNNGGDGLALARMLAGEGRRVEVFTLAPEGKMSDCCRINLERMQNNADNEGIEGISGRKVVRRLKEGDAMPVIAAQDIVVDALFGNGLGRAPEGIAATVIRHINDSRAAVVAIDVPSGMYCDEATPRVPEHPVIRAAHTLTFAPPKRGFLFPENASYAGDWHLLDIGLDRNFIESAAVKDYLVTEEELLPLLRPRDKFDHKGQFGHALIIAGSAGKMGAAVLAARACLRSGAGLVTVRTPGSGVSVLHTAVPEAMAAADPASGYFSQIPDLSPYTAICAGPGLGTGKETAGALKVLIQEAKVPLVFDADALNILAENKTWLAFLPAGSVLTPHPKEFERLAGKSGDSFERNRRQRDFSFRFRCYVVLKGAHTAITTPDGQCFFNPTGNPGMATAGSGDVLTGILAGLLARGYPPREACLLGVFVHGRAGDLAAEKLGYESLISSDIIQYLGKSFQSLYGKL